MKQALISIFLIALTIAYQSCEPAGSRQGETYLHVADDFSEVAVKSAPQLTQAQAEQQFTVSLLDGKEPVIGQYELKEGSIRFLPEKPFEAGKTYRAQFRYNDQNLTRDFYVRAQRGPATKVTAVYPSEPRLIQNLQRLYIEFSQPMSLGSATEQIYFVDQNGNRVGQVFQQKERWNKGRTRLRLDLRPIPYQPGLAWRDSLNQRFALYKKYKLIVSKEMRDAAGFKLSHDFEKSYTVYNAILSRWGNISIYTKPKAGTTQKVILKAGKAYDYESMLKHIWLTDKNNKRINGKAEITDEERSWSFTPLNPWKPEEYKVYIGAFLEDLAGNTQHTSVQDWKIKDQFVLTKDSSAYAWPLSFWPQYND